MTNNVPYKFKSDAVKKSVPFGVTNINQVKRDEVPAILLKAQKYFNKQGSSDYGMYFLTCTGEYESWDQEAIMKKITMLKSDIDQLIFKLECKQ